MNHLKNISLLLYLILPLLLTGQIQIQPGLHWVSESNVHFQIHGLDLDNNGTFDAGNNSTVRFNNITPASAVNVKGSNNIIFHRLEINNNGDTVFLDRNIEVTDTLEMISGILDLNKFDIELGSTGGLKGENPACHISGQKGGVISKTVTLNMPSEEDPGNLGIQITSGSNLGVTIISRGHEVQTSTGNGYGINRYYDISPTNNTGLNATLRFHYMNDELNSITEADLDFFRSTDSGVTWSMEGYDVLNTTDNWIELSGIDGFSRWTIGSNKNNVLPVELVDFSAQCLEGNSLVEWETAAEVDHGYFVVQYSENSRNWKDMEWINSLGNESTGHSYSKLINRSEGYFRLKIVSNSGDEEFSNIMHSDCENNVVVQIYPSLVSNFISVDIINPDKENLRIDLINAIGVQMKEINLSPSASQQNFQYSMAEFPAGNYFLSIRKGGHIWKVIKLVKLRI